MLLMVVPAMKAEPSAELQRLIDRIKDRIQNFGEQDVCWPWVGAKTKAGARLQKTRTSDMVPFYVPTVVSSYGLVKVGKGRRRAVHKIVYEWATPQLGKSEVYRLANECNNTLCCNPAHWRLIDNGPPAVAPEGRASPDAMTILREACEELLESLLAVSQPRSFDEVRNHPYMIDFQPELIKEVLRGIGKGHLADTTAGDSGAAPG